jgi:hypothetical protein
LPTDAPEGSPPRRSRRGVDVPKAPSRAELVSCLLDVSAARLRGPAIEKALFWRPERAPLLAMGTALLDQLERPSPEWRARLDWAWQDEFVSLAERTPHQDLELRWSRALLDGSTVDWRAEDRARALRHGWPALMTADDAYAWTHAIFYLTDFGSQPLDLADEQRIELRRQLDAAIVWSLARYDFDLLSEFLLASVYAGTADTERWRVGFAVLLSTWDQLGWVPDREVEVEGLSLDVARQKLYYAVYHANLVAALLAHEVAARGLAASGDATESPEVQEASPATPAGGALVFGDEIWHRVAGSLPSSAIVVTKAEILLLIGFWRQDLAALLTIFNRLVAAGVESATVAGARHWLTMARGLSPQV